MSRIDSRDISNLLGQLSDSSKQVTSDEEEKFVEALERYQNEAKSIQQAITTIHERMIQQCRSSSKGKRSPKLDATEQMVLNLSERIRRLDDDQIEISQHLSEMSGIARSSVLPVSDIDSDRELETLRKENHALRVQLNAQREANAKLKKGLGNALQLIDNQCSSFASSISDVVDANMKRLDFILQRTLSNKTGTVQDKDKVRRLLAFGCHELAACITSKWRQEQEPEVGDVLDLTGDPAAFGRYINSLCVMCDRGVRALTEEVEAGKLKIEELRSQLDSQQVARDVEETAKRIIASLGQVSDEMRAQHEQLMSSLS